MSITQTFPAYAALCHRLTVGQSAYSLRAEIPYDLHCYRDGWHAYWKNPPHGQIGRKLRSRKLLQAFLDGDWTVGLVIRPPSLRELTSSD